MAGPIISSDNLNKKAILNQMHLNQIQVQMRMNQMQMQVQNAAVTGQSNASVNAAFALTFASAFEHNPGKYLPGFNVKCCVMLWFFHTLTIAP